ncbi:MAG: Nif3-like dinuclear metal center hexameric protein [Bacillota bacterium]|jgi:dinuclear metal center YbgI/SA1388 family protein
MPVTVDKVINIMETIAPRHLAEDWDNIGLQIGHPGEKAENILITLDINEAVVNEAISQGIDLIISHHPLIFEPLKTLRFDTPLGKICAELISNNIAVYAAHTNLDRASGGINDVLAHILGLQNTEVLIPGKEEKLFKVVVFVPEGFLEKVRNALSEAGAGWIGNYSHCTFSVAGKGTFKPLEGTNPFIGTRGKLESVDEYRLETIVPRQKLKQVISAMIKSHPYEEVSYDVYPLEIEKGNWGIGRIGRLKSGIMLGWLAEHVKKMLHTDTVKVVGDPGLMISQIAVCGGAGTFLIDKAKIKGAQCLITGDLKYHEGQHARELGLAVIDAGHYATENLIVPELALRLKKEFEAQNISVAIHESKANVNPWIYL